MGIIIVRLSFVRYFALQCVAKRGDVIATESPYFLGIIELIETLGMKVLEVYTCTDDGVCVVDLAGPINQYDITACFFQRRSITHYVQ